MTSRKLTIPTEKLRLGMFVADLDRSWDGTPFILQGVLVRDPREVNYLRQACRQVVVDVDRSTVDMVDYLTDRAMDVHLTRADGKAARFRFVEWIRSWWETAMTARLGHQSVDDRLPTRLAGTPASVERTSPFMRVGSTVTRFRFSQWIRQWFETAMTALLGRHFVARRPLTRLAGMPADIELVAYRDTKSFDEAIGPARETCREIEETMKMVLDDLAEDREIAVDVLSMAASELVASVAANPEAMMWLTRMRERNVRAYKHSVEVAIYMITFGRHLGFPPAHLEKLCMIGLLLDIGMTRVDNVLLEKVTPLSESERAEIRRHVDHSLEMLTNAPDLDPQVREAIAQHHERIDGSGYPLGLKGVDTSFAGRMVAIVDTFAALTSSRPYADAVSAFHAMKVLSQSAGKLFHEPLVEQFVQAIGLFPVGSLVELSSGQVCAVVSHNKIRRLKPRVLVLTDATKQPLDAPYELNLLLDLQENDDGQLRIWRGLPAGSYGINSRDYFLK
jgi:HD-GYP domain-containing protein (c-di-GMP phosphodiesterase class II)